ncbi:choice-of-anchor Q domain-containing protein [Dokdonella soli]|uniref:CSLREA domain-containing protein n=1 Tax=Dokdonella soli TaxID=529810 RepID=A0ABP3TIM9_9GAMM
MRRIGFHWLPLILAGHAACTCAAVITVTSSSGGSNDGSGCTLRDAITAANTDAPAGTCSPGNGADVVVLPANVTITLTGADNAISSGNGLPVVHSDITVQGNGATIQRDPALSCNLNGVNEPGEFRLLRIESGTVALQHLTLAGGCADDNYATGGGLQNYGTLVISSSVIRGNASHDFGGGILNFGGLVLIDSLLQDNVGGSSGGALYNYDGAHAGISRSAFVHNIASSTGNGSNPSGGAIANNVGSVLDVSNASFNGNQAYLGAALSNEQGTVTLSSASFAGDVVGGNGAGGVLRSYNPPANGSFGIKNCLMGASTAGANCYVQSGGFTMVGANLSSDASCAGFSISQTDPKLAPLGYNGGPTPTFALLAGSPAIDAASDCKDIAGNTLATDQRGRVRPYGPACDLGAYERDDLIFADGFE